jgi:hypothetical protein
MTETHPFDGEGFGGSAFGTGQVAPLIAPGWIHPNGVELFATDSSGWYGVKTLWYATPQYQGPVLVRGRQLDGPHKVFMGEGPDMLDPEWGPGGTINGVNGWREWPGGTWVRNPGCYAFQIDGSNFSDVVVFNVFFRAAS